MASGYTANYGLSLWEPGDAFTRAEFNGDHERVDAALRAVSGAAEGAAERSRRALERLEPVSYNVYNLILQNYYEKKATGWKKALVFDGFLDGSGIASKSPELVLRDGRLTLSRKGQSDHDLGYGSGRGTNLTTKTVSVTGAGSLTGFRFKGYLNWNLSDRPSFQYSLKINGAEAASGRYSWSESYPPEEDSLLTLTLPKAVQVVPGDKVSMSILQSGETWALYQSSSGGGLGGTFLITPLIGEAVTVTTKSSGLPAASGLLGWVRYLEGSIALSVVDGAGVRRALSVGEKRTMMEPMGNRCTEQTFTLESPLAAGSMSLCLELALGGDDTMQFFDYGVSLM